MRPDIAQLVTALAVPGIAALGGAAIVYSEFDDAPGGILLGILLVVAATAIGLRAVRRRG